MCAASAGPGVRLRLTVPWAAGPADVELEVGEDVKYESDISAIGGLRLRVRRAAPASAARGGIAGAAAEDTTNAGQVPELRVLAPPPPSSRPWPACEFEVAVPEAPAGLEVLILGAAGVGRVASEEEKPRRAARFHAQARQVTLEVAAPGVVPPLSLQPVAGRAVEVLLPLWGPEGDIQLRACAFGGGRVGARLWPCALLVAAWIRYRAAYMAGNAVRPERAIELGAGTGACGLALAAHAATPYAGREDREAQGARTSPSLDLLLTDSDPRVLPLLRNNVADAPNLPNCGSHLPLGCCAVRRRRKCPGQGACTGEGALRHCAGVRCHLRA